MIDKILNFKSDCYKTIYIIFVIIKSKLNKLN